MKNEKIEEFERRLSDIQEKPFDEQGNLLIALQKELKLALPDCDNRLYYKVQGIRSFLQTKLMLNACLAAEESSTIAKRSCKWAAVAAIASLIGSIAAWTMLFFSMR